MTHSIIIPYQHSEERKSLLYACLESIVKTSNNKFEICIHEVGPSRTLYLSERYKYLYTQYSGVFHRAWAINKGVKQLSTGDILILMDGDLIVSPEWSLESSNCSTTSIGWGKLHLLNKRGTETYLYKNYIDGSKIYKTKTPSMNGAAGAITIIPRNIFYSLGGIPEDFSGSWGGEDNALWAKLSSQGHKPSIFKSTIFHLEHEKSTPRIRNIQSKAIQMAYWTPTQWTNYIKAIGDSWGSNESKSINIPSTDYISHNSCPKITFAMLSWLRYEKLISTLNTISQNLSIDACLCLMVQGSEKLTKEQKDDILLYARNFLLADVFFTKGNIGTGPARKILSERALNRFNTPYINLSDDDTTFTPNSIEAAIDFMDSNLSIGIAGIRYKPKIYRLNSQINPSALSPCEAKNPIEFVDCTGSASAIVRREVFDLCKIDPFYIIGQWDLDLFLQARSIGWKIANIELFDGMKAINDWGGSQEYKNARMNKQGISRSVKYYKRKWGLGKTV